MLLKLNNIDTLLKYSQIIYLQFVYCIFLMLCFSLTIKLLSQASKVYIYIYI